MIRHMKATETERGNGKYKTHDQWSHMEWFGSLFLTLFCLFQQDMKMPQSSDHL